MTHPGGDRSQRKGGSIVDVSRKRGESPKRGVVTFVTFSSLFRPNYKSLLLFFESELGTLPKNSGLNSCGVFSFGGTLAWVPSPSRPLPPPPKKKEKKTTTGSASGGHRSGSSNSRLLMQIISSAVNVCNERLFFRSPHTTNIAMKFSLGVDDDMRQALHQQMVSTINI